MGGPNPEAAFKGYIEDNSWVIITGHGAAGGNYQALSSGSVKCSVNEYAALIVGHHLKPGHRINVLLFACDAAVGNPSFAKQLADKLSNASIDSHIVALVGACPRLRCMPIENFIIFDVLGEKKSSNSIVVFETKNKITQTYFPTQNIFIRPDGVHEALNPFYNNIYCHDAKFRSRVDDLYGELAYKMYRIDKSRHLFLMDALQAENHLRASGNHDAVIHLSPHGKYQITYFENDEIKHQEVRTIESVDKLMEAKNLIIKPGVAGLFDTQPVEKRQRSNDSLISKINML